MYTVLGSQSQSQAASRTHTEYLEIIIKFMQKFRTTNKHRPILKKLRSAFDELDTDGSGELSLQEVGKLLKNVEGSKKTSLQSCFKEGFFRHVKWR